MEKRTKVQISISDLALAIGADPEELKKAMLDLGKRKVREISRIIAKEEVRKKYRMATGGSFAGAKINNKTKKLVPSAVRNSTSLARNRADVKGKNSGIPISKLAKEELRVNQKLETSTLSNMVTISMGIDLELGKRVVAKLVDTKEEEPGGSQVRSARASHSQTSPWRTRSGGAKVNNWDKEVAFFNKLYSKLFPLNTSTIDSLVLDYSSARQRYRPQEILLALIRYSRYLSYHPTAKAPLTAKQFLAVRDRNGPVDHIRSTLALFEVVLSAKKESGEITVSGEEEAFREEERIICSEMVSKALMSLTEEERKEVMESWEQK